MEKGLQALREGVSIITDTNMGRAGINKKKLEKYGGKVHCFMADEDVAAAALAQQTTRAAVSMDKAAAMQEDLFCHRQCAYCLIRLYELIQEEKIRPR